MLSIFMKGYRKRKKLNNLESDERNDNVDNTELILDLSTHKNVSEKQEN